ncbi:cytochrome C biogenesis protein CcmF [Sulfuricaulis limicola]|uniref:Cytochrome C biogenesis protein CcmF n=1 Tax=Sulfuricaulis limicola TaxID=1620215 RepID=A0A1B4XEH1_9GAMM|nr:heme lyase CcmF/NrfE family subunit [Sulfuricaulis limicola]BAV33205.1 cytochrome C biogenesis protein CcmF [Sulfuricaulis limicola]
MSANILSLNLVELGHFCAYLAMLVALVQGLAPMAAHYLKQPRLAQISVNGSVAVFALTTLGGLSLIHAFVTSNFSVQYVAQNSNALLPLFYKVAALWGGHEGSLYLWVWVLTLYTMIVGIHGRKQYPEHLPVILAVQGWLVVGFFGLILFLSNPFERLFPVPPEGHDLNPLLQDPGMVFHPPMLYLGYVGFSVPFAFAMTALITRWRSELWIGLIRRWALIAWGFLTTGIILGGWWAYYELGWGGYWAWDPVENASFMPWLLGTALVHSITVQDRRRMLHAWNIFLVISTFSLSLLGTFLVRSGVLSSVHAFAVDPGRGAYILGFMTAVLTVSFGIFLARGRYQQAEEAITSFLSRESLFVWNNVLFLVACASVLLGTLYPLALDALSGQKITVGAPYFNIVMVPIFLVIVLLMAVGPLVPWRKANLARLRPRLLWPFLIGVAAAAAVLVFLPAVHWTGPVAVGLALFALANLITEFSRAIRQRRLQLKEPLPRACVKTVLGNRRHYGGMIVHFGIVVIALGLVGSGLFRSEAAINMAPGDVVEIAGERLRFEGVAPRRGQNYEAMQASLTLLNSGRMVRPERRQYMRQEMPMTETGIDSTMLRDVYVALGDTTSEGRWAVHVYVNPLVRFIWTGGLIILSGLLLSLSGRRANKISVTADERG